MTVESNYAIAIAMLGDCFDYLIPGFQPARSKSKMEEGGRGAEARENMGREGYGRRKTRKGGRRDLNEGRKRERNSKRNAFVIFLLLIIHSKHEATNIFRLPFNSSETLNKILYARKRKFVLGLISVKLETFRCRYTRFSVRKLSKLSARNNRAGQVKCRRRPF